MVFLVFEMDQFYYYCCCCWNCYRLSLLLVVDDSYCCCCCCIVVFEVVEEEVSGKKMTIAFVVLAEAAVENDTLMALVAKVAALALHYYLKTASVVAGIASVVVVVEAKDAVVDCGAELPS